LRGRRINTPQIYLLLQIKKVQFNLFLKINLIYKYLVFIMSWDKELNLQQLDETLVSIHKAIDVQRPASGWINTVRTTLGMSARSLGERIGLSQPRIALMEKGEIDGSISIKTLEKAAQGLGCRLVYVLLPEDGSLQKMRHNQAMKKAKNLNAYAERHMELEEQATDNSFRNATTKKIAEDYLRTWPRDFWGD
jgi:XRE family transcriptional regulator, regulator of sulfur utilization